MDELVFIAVLASRFLVPLAIPKFPLPAIVAALVIDAADQSIFSAFGVEPDNYQSYDKALDVYYLTIAYVSTLRNWTDGVAFRTGQFLWYFRLVGVVVFELTEVRALLLIFPNTFEYFFLAYEAVRTKWEPSRLTTRHVIGLAAVIWVFVKLPQEWWIHIAQLDVTDVIGNNAWVLPAAAVALVVVSAVGYDQRNRIPATNWSFSLDVDAHPTTVVGEPADPPSGTRALINRPIVEKTVLVGLVTVIFLQLLPAIDIGPIEAVVGVGMIIALNSAIGRWLVRRGTTWRSTGTQFAAMAMINVAI
ncbi:MAG: hypothetical protein WA964_08750, partial [Ilumatobacter sp.]|uniref:hypothetical protein n=1 Tax=Ilumatobacter sp. TaxID=1967498 RepID=UPI003C7394B8